MLLHTLIVYEIDQFKFACQKSQLQRKPFFLLGLSESPFVLCPAFAARKSMPSVRNRSSIYSADVSFWPPLALAQAAWFGRKLPLLYPLRHAFAWLTKKPNKAPRRTARETGQRKSPTSDFKLGARRKLCRLDGRRERAGNILIMEERYFWIGF